MLVRADWQHRLGPAQGGGLATALGRWFGNVQSGLGNTGLAHSGIGVRWTTWRAARPFWSPAAGTLGGHVLTRLHEAGRPVRVLSRRHHEDRDGVTYVTGDLRKNTGIEPAVEGVETILHLAGGPRGDDEATRNLMRVAASAGVRQVVYISVVGRTRSRSGTSRRSTAPSG